MLFLLPARQTIECIKLTKQALGFYLLLIGMLTPLAAHAKEVPACRLDNALSTLVERPLLLAWETLKEAGYQFPFKQILINPAIPHQDALNVSLIKDATDFWADKEGCLSTQEFTPKSSIMQWARNQLNALSNHDSESAAIIRQGLKGIINGHSPPLDGSCVPGSLKKCSAKQEERIWFRPEQFDRFGKAGACYLTNLQACTPEEKWLLLENNSVRDAISVKGVCNVSTQKHISLRCSSGALKILLGRYLPEGSASPSILYLLAHELGHLAMTEKGKFTSTGKALPLSADSKKKLKWLRQGCLDTSQSRHYQAEEEADRLAILVLKKSLGFSPYKENVLNRQNARIWGADLIRLNLSYLKQWDGFWASDANSRLQSVYDPDSLPLPASEAYVSWAAKRFVCDLIAENEVGELLVPFHSLTHPPATARMSLVSKTLRKKQPTDSHDSASLSHANALGLDPFAELMGQLGEVFSHIDQQYAEYHNELQKNICLIAYQRAKGLICADISVVPQTQ